MIHASAYKPRVIPFTSSQVSTQMDRVQDITASVTLNKSKIQEVGRDGVVDWRKLTPTLNLTVRQLEYGEMEFWRQLANTTLTDTKVLWTDVKTTQIDICAYETDDSGTYVGTVWYPNLKLAGFSLSIGDPNALIERNFSFVGEDEITLQGDNKYLIELLDTSCTTTNHTIIFNAGTWINYPIPIADPDSSGSATYMLKVVRVRSGVATELTVTTDYTYTPGTRTLAMVASVSGDTYRVFYSAGVYITLSSVFTNNDADAAGISADSCSIYLKTTGNYVYRLQSVGLDVTFDRYDLREIGDDDVVARGVRNITCRVTLGRILESYTVEEVLRGVSAGYGKIDITNFTDNFALIIKIYSSSAKSTFLIGYKITDLAPVGMDAGTPVNDYITQGTTLEGEVGFVTSNEGEL